MKKNVNLRPSKRNRPRKTNSCTKRRSGGGPLSFVLQSILASRFKNTQYIHITFLALARSMDVKGCKIALYAFFIMVATFFDSTELSHDTLEQTNSQLFKFLFLAVIVSVAYKYDIMLAILLAVLYTNLTSAHAFMDVSKADHHHHHHHIIHNSIPNQTTQSQSS